MRTKIVKQAESWIGKKEKDGSFKVIIDIYNAHKPLARSYKVKYTDEWCATFASAVAIKCGATDIIPTECSCAKMIELFKGKGSWQENDAYVPSGGDYIFYDWEDSGKGDNTGRPNHVGIVQKVEGSTIYVIEGNYNEKVAIRKIAVNAKYIRGFGVPKYKAQPKEPVKQETAKPVTFTVGDRVMLTADATSYGKTTRFSSWVYNSVLYVRQIKGDRIVISTQKTGAITGAVAAKHLKKV